MTKQNKKSRSYFGAGFSQASFERPSAQTKPPKALLIVTEGQNTEPLYFKNLASHWSLHPHVTTIEPGGEGIPANLVKTALKVIKQRTADEKAGRLPFNQLGSFDETWIVFDTEHAARHSRLDDGVELAKAHKIQIAHSSPCFEFWLALHYALKARPMDTCAEACRLFEEAAHLKRGSYSKSNGATSDLIEKLICKVPDAVRNADLLFNQNAVEPFPVNPSTSVQALVRSMHDALPEVMKNRFPLPSLPDL
jgi:RloB-like protein